ncbi:MAG: sigma-70 family RNA polymerase sigma factor [Bacillota bacterium]
MKIKYEYSKNEVVEIEVDEGLGAVILELDRQEYNVNQKETRRHVLFSALPYEGELLASDFNLEAQFIISFENEKLINCISQLLPKQQELLKKVYFDGISASEIARQEGVNKSSVHKRLQRIIEQLKKSLT